MAKESGTKENPWKLKTPPKTSEYEMYIDEKDGIKIIRELGDSTEVYNFDYEEVEKKTDLKKNIALVRGDVILVP